MLRAPSIVSARRATLRVAVSLTALAIGTGGLGIASATAATPAAITITATGHPSSVKPTLHGQALTNAKHAAFGKSVLAIAARYVGTPYVYGASGPGAFDCSGFTRYVFAQVGVSLAHSSYSQYSETRHIPQSQALPGDIVFLSGLGHVGIYAGHGMMYDAPSPGGAVSLRPIYSSSYEIGRVRY